MSEMPAQRIALPPARILAIDDTPINLALLSGMLQPEFQVTTAESAITALALLKESSYDLIILDIMMPGMDGFEAITQFRQIDNARNTPVIFLTGSDDRQSETRGLSLGAIDFIFKPIRADLVKLRIRNILKMTQLSESLISSEALLRYVMEATGDGIWDWHVGNAEVFHNPAWCQILGLDGRYLAHPIAEFVDLVHEEDLPAVKQRLDETLSGIRETYNSEHRMRHESGNYIWVQDRGRVVKRAEDGSALRMVGCIKDISERKRNEAEIFNLAFYDQLTELPNRRLLLDRLQHRLVRNLRCKHHSALMFIDMDRFKALNDLHGHAMGDLLLIQVASRLQKSVRQQDTVARLGGDEFVVLIEDLDENPDQARDTAKRIGEKILTALNHPYQLGQISYASTPSIGISLFAGDGHDIDEILTKADHAMYAAKSAGRNTLHMS